MSCTEDPGFGQEHSRPVTELPVVINQNQVYINGQFVDAITAEQIDVIDPATSDVIARVPNAGRADVQKAVAAARAAFDNGPWSDSGLDGPTALQRLSRDDAPQYLLHD